MTRMRTNIRCMVNGSRFLDKPSGKAERMVKGLRLIVGLMLCLSTVETRAQVFQVAEGATDQGNHGATENVVVADGFWKNWFVQFGLDMTLQNPYGYNFSKVFPNGKSFGLDLAVGKWFSHQVGVRGKFNWENKLPLLKNDHANWLAPFDQPGENRRKGGYIAFYGDVLLNLHNFFGTYRSDRTWNISMYPRIGVNYNFGVSKGSLLAGIGVLNTYRINDRWSVYGDIAYIMTGSGFVGKDKVKGTGTGSNSNGYLTIGLGAQVELGPLGRSEKGKVFDQGTKRPKVERKSEKSGVLTNGIWDNWFVQFGADMSLLNPYGCNFSKVIPKGMTFGLNGAMGKWFTPEFALRGRVQWDNGLIPNNGLEWVAPAEDPKQNYKKGGMATFAIDAMLNLTNVFRGYDSERKWHTTGYVRAGIITQFAEGSGSPLLGAGVEETYRLNDRWSLFGALGYQVSTSEGMGYSTTGVDVAAGTNGFFDIDFGVRLDIGENRFYRASGGQSPYNSKGYSHGAPQGHNWPKFAVNTIASVGVAYIGKTALKAMIKEERPDHSDNKSFPSGHAAMAFAAARSIDKEFRKDCIWIPIAGYAAATAVGIQRVARDRHHWYDVLAGAAVGVGATELTWWLSGKLFPERNIAVGVSPTGVSINCDL